MSDCTGATAACDGIDVRPVRLGISHREHPMCAGCRETLAAMGAIVRIVERREAPRGPRWLQRLTASDRTGELIA
jgi:hypothetical protein